MRATNTCRKTRRPPVTTRGDGVYCCTSAVGLRATAVKQELPPSNYTVAASFVPGTSFVETEYVRPRRTLSPQRPHDKGAQGHASVLGILAPGVRPPMLAEHGEVVHTMKIRCCSSLISVMFRRRTLPIAAVQQWPFVKTKLHSRHHPSPPLPSPT